MSGLYVRQVVRDTVETRVANQQYVVVLGDSVASGAGLKDGRQAPGCDVSDQAFPFVLGKLLGKPVEQFACSGATVAATQTKVTGTVVEQLEAAREYIPGSLVVVNAGANDTGWLQLIVSCTTENCATDKNRTTLESELAPLKQNLAALLTEIQQMKPQSVVVNTYYDLLNPGDTCFERLGVSAEEATFIHEEAAKLNGTIAAAARQSNTNLVQIDFSGHLLCDAVPWIQNATSKAPLHPTSAGQQQIAAQDAQALKELTPGQ